MGDLLHLVIDVLGFASLSGILAATVWCLLISFLDRDQGGAR